MWWIVSILIVLEISLEDVNDTIIVLHELMFQSLLFWKSVWKNKIIYQVYFVFVFQSLLFWKSVWKRNDTRWNARLYWFQSLLFWKSVWKIFNPSYHNGIGLVSILIVLEISLEAYWPLIIPPCPASFQSLLFWKSVWKKRHEFGVVVRKPCFNPYCFGNQFGRLLASRRGLPVWPVSILIVLEISLEDYVKDGIFIASLCFNPYCFGNQFGRLLPFGGEKHESLFQSLLFWKSVWKQCFEDFAGRV